MDGEASPKQESSFTQILALGNLERGGGIIGQTCPKIAYQNGQPCDSKIKQNIVYILFDCEIEKNKKRYNMLCCSMPLSGVDKLQQRLMGNGIQIRTTNMSIYYSLSVLFCYLSFFFYQCIVKFVFSLNISKHPVNQDSHLVSYLGILKRAFTGCREDKGGSPSASSMAVIPRDQTSQRTSQV